MVGTGVSLFVDTDAERLCDRTPNITTTQLPRPVGRGIDSYLDVVRSHSVDLIQPPCLHVIDESGDRDVVRDQR